jgi:hypothetical protein
MTNDNFFVEQQPKEWREPRLLWLFSSLLGSIVWIVLICIGVRVAHAAELESRAYYLIECYQHPERHNNQGCVVWGNFDSRMACKIEAGLFRAAVDGSRIMCWPKGE